ncbi:unnamed protein product [Darwinula stevensoni]|uniref:Uncharacterized protein n=1 Tax=Darwinula stevensoni TaxID=69355 RepID=A0A7R8ZZL4_9CRUS|nr:unnamed protein product [Darwinula stevensoni]CAG0879060.1 unnamed protein product [Darwinula stevensoni]
MERESAMGNSFRAHFNDYLGSNVTHVANAYSRSKDERLWLCYQTEELELKALQLELKALQISAAASGEPILKADWQKSTKSSWQSIAYRDFVKIRRNNAFCYLTVVTHDNKLLFQNHEVDANRSIIIDSNGTIKPQKYGGPIWEDEGGKNHYPK